MTNLICLKKAAHVWCPLSTLIPCSYKKKKKERQKERTKKYIFNDRTELEDCQRKEIGYKMTCHHGRGVTAKVNTAPLFISSPRFLNSITSSSLTYKHRTYFCVRHKKKYKQMLSWLIQHGVLSLRMKPKNAISCQLIVKTISVRRGCIDLLTGPGGPGGPTSPWKSNRNIVSVAAYDGDRATSWQWQKRRNIKKHLRNQCWKQAATGYLEQLHQ